MVASSDRHPRETGLLGSMHGDSLRHEQNVARCNRNRGAAVNDSAVARARRLIDGYGRHLVAVRKQQGVTLRGLAAIVDIDAPTLTRIESARQIPTPDQERRLSDWLLQHPLLDETG